MSDDIWSVWIGFDPREAGAYAVARMTARRAFRQPVPIHGLVLDQLKEQKLYWRETERHDGRLWDVISTAPMATEFAISRFLVPHLAKTGWALFMDCDMLIRANNLADLFALRDPSKAVMCVQHDFRPKAISKMDGQVQTLYPRKNWSSVMLFNCDHPANKALTVEMVNTLPGRDLHRFCWLDDAEVGSLGPEWNWLVNHSSPEVDPKIVHFTDGLPFMEGYENDAYADEWRKALAQWAR